MPSSRRTFLRSVGVTGASVTLAGCSALSRLRDPDDPPPSGVDGLPDPEDSISGANGEWSTFGCNAANTRAIADGGLRSTASPSGGA